MFKTLILIGLLLPLLSKGQAVLARRYVKTYNELTYLKFKSDSTFEFRYVNDLMGDESLGHYKQHNDTILLTYIKNSRFTGTTYLSTAIGVRADSLVIKGNKLYEIKNGKSTSSEPQEITYTKPPNNWNYKRKYIFFGPWRSNYIKYYMIDERNAPWATKKWLKAHKDLFD